MWTTCPRHIVVTGRPYHHPMTTEQTTTMDDRAGAVVLGLGGMVREQMLPLKTLLRLQPEARLALAVLEDAAETLRTTQHVETLRARRLAAHTWLWVESDDAHQPFAFRVICQHLELDAEWLRAGLARWRPLLPPRPIHDEVSAGKRRRAA